MTGTVNVSLSAVLQCDEENPIYSFPLCLDLLCTMMMQEIAYKPFFLCPFFCIWALTVRESSWLLLFATREVAT